MTRLLAALALGVVCVLASTSIAGAEPHAPRPTWQSLPVPNVDSGRPPIVIGAASGRGWIGFATANRPMVLAAVQGSGAKLSVVTTTSVPAQNGLILGSELLYHPPHISGKGGELGSVPLLANGRVGASGPVPGDPESKVSQEYGPRVFNAIRIGARTVWLIGGGESRGISSFKPRLWACCTEAGEARELTSSVLARTPNAHSAQLGLDAGGRLWLAWSNPARMVELDPATLVPRTAPSVIPGGTPDKLTLLCDVACRVVEYDSGDTAGIFSWAPGERLRTRIVRPTRRGTHTIVPALLAASYRAGGLTVAYSLAGWNPRTSASLVRVVRGDARGSRGRIVGSTEIPWSIPPAPHNTGRNVVFLNGEAYGTFIPAGLVAVGLYQQTSRSLAVGAFVPLAR